MHPVISNYNIRTYSDPKQGTSHNQNWGIVQDSRGIVYIANQDFNTGVLEFDGTTWRHLPTAKTKSVKSLAIDHKNVLYVGAENEFGYFELTNTGGRKFVSLSDAVPDSIAFSDVWTTIVLEGKVFFQSREAIFLYENDTLTTFLPSDYFHKSFSVGNSFWVRAQGEGLLEYRNGRLVLLKGSEFFREMRVDAILPYRQDTLLIATRSSGLYTYHIASGVVAKQITALDKEWETHNIYGGSLISNDRYAFITLNNGLYVLSKDLSLLRHISRKGGLQTERVWNLLEDSEHNVWLALDKGIDRIELSRPIRKATEGAGYSGEINDIVRHIDRLYVATSQGVFEVVELASEGEEQVTEIFQNLPAFNVISWALASSGKDLFIAGNDGTYLLKDKEKRPQLLSAGSPKILHYVEGKRPLMIAAGATVEIFEPSGASWKKTFEYEDVEGDIRSLAVRKHPVTGHLDLWLGDIGTGVYQMEISIQSTTPRLESIQLYDKSNGLDEEYVFVQELEDQITVGTNKGLFRYHPDDNRFVPFSAFGAAFNNPEKQVYKTFKGIKEDYWLVMDEKVYNVYPTKNGLAVDSLRLRTLNAGIINCVYPEPNGQVWIGGYEELVQYDPFAPTNIEKSYTAIIRRVTLRNGEVLFDGHFFDPEFPEKGLLLSQPPSQAFNLSYESNDLIISFAAVRFETNLNVLYAYKLEGYEKQFSPWSADNKATYTNLKPGKYVFQVKAIDAYGIESKVGTFSFTILPPWWATWWFYTVEVGALLSLVVLSYVVNQSGTNSRLSYILTFVTIITLFEFFIMLFEGYVDNISGGVPVLKLLTNVALAVSLNPLERLFSRILERSKTG